MKLSIIIPVYNEKSTVRAIIDKVNAVAIDKELIIVDDFSNDGTREILREIEKEITDGSIKFLYHETNMGKGAGIRTGIREVTGDFVIIQDADLEYNPEDYHRLLKPVLEADADVVYGSRFLGGEYVRVLYFWHMIGNKFLTLLSNMFTNLNLTDMETCYKLIRSSFLKRITVNENRFGFEPEITAKLSKLNCKFFEVSVSYSGRTYEEGKKINWKDGCKAIWCIIRYNIFK